MAKKIFLDSDGVIRDFVKACEKRYKRTFSWEGQRDVREHLGFTDIQWKEELEISGSSFFNRSKFDFKKIK